MDCTEIVVDVAPEVVWATLADASTFEEWVVGCKEVRYVEGDWPHEGSKLHHSVGAGPATIDDTTSVTAAEEGRHLALRARFRPAGIATVDLRLEPAAEGKTRVVMQEEIVEGLISHVPHVLTDPLIHPRNGESLRRLKNLAEGRPAS